MIKTIVKSSKLVFCTYLSHFLTVLDDFFSGQPVRSSTLSPRVRVRVRDLTPRGWPVPLPRNQSGWVKALPLICFQIMNTVNKSTGFSPFQLRYGRSARVGNGTGHPRGVGKLTRTLTREDRVLDLTGWPEKKIIQNGQEMAEICAKYKFWRFYNCFNHNSVNS